MYTIYLSVMYYWILYPPPFFLTRLLFIEWSVNSFLFFVAVFCAGAAAFGIISRKYFPWEGNSIKPVFGEETSPDSVKNSGDFTTQKKIGDIVADLLRLIEDTSDAVFSTDMDLKLITWSKASEKLFGYPEPEILGKEVLDVLAVRMPEGKRLAIRRQLAGTGYWKGEMGFAPQNHSGLRVRVSMSLTRKDCGEPDGYLIVCRDITERKAHTDQPRQVNEDSEKEGQENTKRTVQSEKKYKMLFDNNPMPMWMLSLDNFRIIEVNQAALRHYGYNREEFLAIDAR
ncbi:MAG TPA: PAS domain S-box protein, partial [Puia sp.]